MHLLADDGQKKLPAPVVLQCFQRPTGGSNRPHRLTPGEDGHCPTTGGIVNSSRHATVRKEPPTPADNAGRPLPDTLDAGDKLRLPLATIKEVRKQCLVKWSILRNMPDTKPSAYAADLAQR